METLPAPLVWSAYIYGTFTGSLKDPVFIGILVIAVSIGATRKPWWMALAFALAAALARFLISANNRQAAGLDFAPIMGWSALMTVLAVMLIWLTTSLIARPFNRPTE